VLRLERVQALNMETRRAERLVGLVRLRDR
jgi:hypothetical protein